MGDDRKSGDRASVDGERTRRWRAGRGGGGENPTGEPLALCRSAFGRKGSRPGGGHRAGRVGQGEGLGRSCRSGERWGPGPHFRSRMLDCRFKHGCGGGFYHKNTLPC